MRERRDREDEDKHRASRERLFPVDVLPSRGPFQKGLGAVKTFAGPSRDLPEPPLRLAELRALYDYNNLTD